MKDFLNKFSNVRKLVVAVVGLGLLVAAPFSAEITESSLYGVPMDTLVNVIVALLTAVGVYTVPNTPSES